MLTLGPLAFAAPWLLVALATLPVLWWLLKVTPPAPRRLSFPAIRLLFGLNPEETAARTPWWLLALRVLAAALVVIGLAQPVLNPAHSPGGAGPLLLVIDDGWAAASDWPLKRAALDGLVDQAEREGRVVGILATSPGPRGEPVAASPILPAAEARRRLAGLKPNPWAPDGPAPGSTADRISTIVASP